jgi:hypothetical protein
VLYIKDISYGSGSIGSHGFGGQSSQEEPPAPGAPQSPTSCPAIKYSGDIITLKATPADGIGPYIVTFKKEDITINPSRLGGLSNPITNATENTQITRVYTLNDLDISSAITGNLTFSVEVSDSCPVTSMTCSSICIITVGCVAPVCNFTVT